MLQINQIVEMRDSSTWNLYKVLTADKNFALLKCIAFIQREDLGDGIFVNMSNKNFGLPNFILQNLKSMKLWFKNLLLTLIDLLRPSSEENFAANIYTSMWAEGYTDFEIEQAIAAYHEAKLSEDRNE